MTTVSSEATPAGSVDRWIATPGAPLHRQLLEDAEVRSRLEHIEDALKNLFAEAGYGIADCVKSLDTSAQSSAHWMVFAVLDFARRSGARLGYDVRVEAGGQVRARFCLFTARPLNAQGEFDCDADYQLKGHGEFSLDLGRLDWACAKIGEDAYARAPVIAQLASTQMLDADTRLSAAMRQQLLDALEP
jgi:hypothetical protein